MYPKWKITICGLKLTLVVPLLTWTANTCSPLQCWIAHPLCPPSLPPDLQTPCSSSAYHSTHLQHKQSCSKFLLLYRGNWFHANYNTAPTLKHTLVYFRFLSVIPHYRLGSSPRHHNQFQGPTSHTLLGYWGQLPGDQAARTWSWPITSAYCWGQECVTQLPH